MSGLCRAKPLLTLALAAFGLLAIPAAWADTIFAYSVSLGAGVEYIVTEGSNSNRLYDLGSISAVYNGGSAGASAWRTPSSGIEVLVVTSAI